MKYIRYICNLCGEYHEPKEAHGKIHAYYWNSGILPQRFEITRFNADCDRHICTKCIQTIQSYPLPQTDL